MAAPLPTELIDETRRALDHVVRLNLPAPVWPAVGERLHRIDAAAESGDAAWLGAELATLRGMGVGPSVPEPPGGNATPGVGPPGGYLPPPGGYLPPPPMAGPLAGYPMGAPKRSWKWLILGGVAAVVLFVVLAAVVLTVGDSGDTSTMPTSDTSRTATPTSDVQSTTGDAPPPSTDETPPPSDSNDSGDSIPAGVAAAIGIAAVAAVTGIAVVLVMLQRNRSGASRSVASSAPAYRPVVPQSPPPLPAPHEIVELVNRTVHTLAAQGGRT